MKEYDKYDSAKYVEVLEDMVIAKGGDGTLLTAINKFRHLNLPFYGVAGGTKNFLMNKEAKRKTNCKVLQFNLLQVEVFSDTVDTFYAFNDVVIGNFNGWIEFQSTHEDDQLGTFKGSGIVISTAQGSTGINRNNHGTILPLSSKNWSITGMQSNRVVNAITKPTGLTIAMNSRGTVKAAIDGTNHVVDDVHKVVITQGPTVEVIFNYLSEFQRKRQ